MAPSREDELGQRVTPFLTKTYQLVDDHSTDDVVSWNSDGTGFVVRQPAEFARDILPLFFKHNNLSSFVRQLNTYAFCKISDRWEFTHASFRRGEKRLLSEIRRRQRFTPTPAGLLVNGDASPTNSSEEQATCPDTAVNCNGSTQLEEENTRLRKENRRLSEELGRMRKVCNNIFNLVSDLKSTEVKGDDGSSGPTGPLQLLDLMPAEVLVDNNGREGCNTKLFGVSILAKPFRDVVHGDDMDLDLNPRTLDLAGPAELVQPDESSFI